MRPVIRNPFDLFAVYMAMCAHYNEKTNYNLDEGKIRYYKSLPWNNVKGKAFYERIFKKYNFDSFDFILSCFMKKPDIGFIAKIDIDESHKNYARHLRTMQTLKYSFTSKVGAAIDRGRSLEKLLTTDNGVDLPPVFHEVGDVELIIIIDDLTQFMKKCDIINNDFKKLSYMMKQSRCFIDYDKKEFSKILRKLI